MATLRQFQFAALGIVLLTTVTRLPSLVHRGAIDDEAIYSVVATEIVDGGRPYVDAVERKPPLLFWTYAAIYETAGKYNWHALHIVALLWTLGIMGGLYVIGRTLFNRETGLVAALFYAIFQHWGIWKNQTFDGEMLMNLPIVWAWAIALRRTSSRFRFELFGAGALLAVAFLLKQPAAIAAVPLGVYLLLPAYRQSRRLQLADSIFQAVIFAAGFLLMLGFAGLVLWDRGILGESFYWTIEDHDIPHVFWTKGEIITLSFAAVCLPLLVAAVLSFQDRDRVWIDHRAERTALLGLLAASAIGCVASGRFYPHYYIQLLPPLALLAAPYSARLWSGQMKPPYWLLRPGLTFIWLSLIILSFLIDQSIGISRCRRSPASRYLSKHSQPTDRIFVWGQAPRIYLDAQRRPACRYVTTFPLTGYVFGGPIAGFDTRSRILAGAWNNLEQDFAKHPPLFVVDVHDPSHAVFPVRDFPVLQNLLASDYVRAMVTADGVIYRRK